ncbi:MAG: glutamate-5-semialdehyde dehydrogenase, partial [Candidatus Omnitrophota bacterium]
MSTQKQIMNMAKSAREAAYALALVPPEEKNAALSKMAKALLSRMAYLIKENNKDVRSAQAKKYPWALIDRLTLNEKRIREMADCLSDTAALKDPVGTILQTIKRPNGLVIKKIRTPFGVIGIIYESRPNVTSDCIGLCLKSSNAVILKGGREAYYSNRAIFTVMQAALQGTRIPSQAIHFISSRDRQAVNVLLGLDRYVDLIIPRGGEGLIRFVAEHSRIPVIKHYKGICHVYVSEYANLNMAHKICWNAKVQRPGVCNAMETMLVHREAAIRFLPRMVDDFVRAGVEIRGCPVTSIV